MTRAFIILFLLCSNLAEAQTGFSRTYEDLDGNAGVSVLVEPDGYLVCGMGFAATIDEYVAIKLYKLDFDGNLQWTKYYGKKYFGYFPGSSGSFIKLDDGYALGGRIMDTANYSYPMFFRFDRNGDSVVSKQLTLASGNRTRCKKWLPNRLALVGTSYTTREKEMQMMIVDSIGSIQWSRNFGGTWDDIGRTIDITDDGGFILGGTTEIDEFRTTMSYVVKTDSTGQMQWEKKYRGSKNCQAAVSLSMDGGYYLWGCRDTLIPPALQPTAAFVIKLNEFGDKVWERYFNSSSVNEISQLRELTDGTILLIGTVDQPGSFYNAGWISRLDNSGNLIWNRSHSYFQNNIGRYVNCDLIDFQPVDDGFIMTGNCLVFTDTLGHYRQDMWLMKLDENGCLNGDCGFATAVTNVQQTAKLLKLYPNPATDQLIIEVPDYKEPQMLTLYDITGKKQKEIQLTQAKTIIDISTLAEGLYIYKCGSAMGKVQIVR